MGTPFKAVPASNVCFLTYLCILCRFPWFLWVGLFMAFFNAFFPLARLCTMFGSIFHRRKSSFSFFSCFFMWSNSALTSCTSTWVQCFIYSSFLYRWQNHVIRFILWLDSKGERIRFEYVLYRFICYPGSYYIGLYL